MSIIASIILAASYTFTPADFPDTPEPDTIGQHETAVTNETPWTIVESNVLEFCPGNDSGPRYDCYVRLTVTEYTNLTHQVSVLWAERIERLASIEAHKAKVAKDKSAIERVKENERKHKSVMGKSVPTGKRSGGAK